MENALSAVWSLMDRILAGIIFAKDVIKRLAMIPGTAPVCAGLVTGWLRPTARSGNRGLHIYVRAHSSRTKLNGINTKKDRKELLNQIKINTWREILVGYKRSRIKNAMDRFSI